MKKEHSAGGIIFNEQGQIIICRPTNHQIWVYPKGRVEAGEDPKDAALREVQEEAGVIAEIIGLAGELNYILNHPERGELDKTVTIYIMKYLSGDINVHDWEMAEVIWVHPDQAMLQLTYDKDKALLENALKVINQNV